MTIEERADRIIYNPEDGRSLTRREVIAYAKGYELGATAQKILDIDKACEWLKNDLADVMEENVFQKMLCRFRKAMEG